MSKVKKNIEIHKNKETKVKLTKKAGKNGEGNKYNGKKEETKSKTRGKRERQLEIWYKERPNTQRKKVRKIER